MSITTEAQRNKLMHLENSLIMYGVYNVENFRKIGRDCASFTYRWVPLKPDFLGA